MRKVVVEGETKVSVVDVIFASKDCTANYAAQVYSRLVADSQVPFLKLQHAVAKKAAEAPASQS
eukprot:10797862-Karenia_brevis.AAC.1